jgi:chitinase
MKLVSHKNVNELSHIEKQNDKTALLLINPEFDFTRVEEIYSSVITELKASIEKQLSTYYQNVLYILPLNILQLLSCNEELSQQMQLLYPPLACL